MSNACYFLDFKRCLAMGRMYCQADQCSFRQSYEEQKASLDAAHKRLRSLPEYQQLSISGKYYGGQRPWRNENEKKAY